MELTVLLDELCRQGGSDLHLVSGSVPRLRVDGHLRPMEFPVLVSQDISRLTASLLTEAQHHQVMEAGEWDGAYSVPAIGRFRVHVYTQRGSLALAIRAVSVEIPTFVALGLPPIVEELMRKPQGLILVTGPTGSGKSTTLASMLDHINEERRAHIISLEDPIEILHAHKKSLVSQMEVGSDVRDFQSALKGILRQDPDVVFLGELRDLETIQAALTMAETGHLTVATLHTNSAIHTLTRLVSVFPPHQQQEIRIQLSMVLEGILSQRLLSRSEGKGRVLALEILISSPAIRNLIREDKIHQMYSMMQTGQAQYGMQTMNQALADLAGQGVISSELAMGLTTLPDELSKLLERTGRDRSGGMSLARLRNRM
ncbi:MAG TPA: type IV pilus twitching motility protein PilT [Nitrospirales bacterium]|nr:type IV pilus twitching motility protein PilT [Nitrospirales bacterium]